MNGGLLVLLVIVALGPILWLAKSAVTPTQDTLRDPMALWPNGIDWENLRTAWVDIDLKLYFWNTVVIAARLVGHPDGRRGHRRLRAVDPAAAGQQGALRRWCWPRCSCPTVVLLVPLYLTVLDMPFTHTNLVNTLWGAFLPAGASAFNVALVKRFFDNLPREIIEAARVDGCGDFRLFWTSCCRCRGRSSAWSPSSRCSRRGRTSSGRSSCCPTRRSSPCRCGCPRLANVTELDVLLAALLISCALPIVFFLVFQRLFLRGGLEGAVKG